MAGSRHLQGTIISRVSTLLKSGSLKQAPVWYDVIRRFPPPKTAILSLVPKREEDLPEKIYFPNDELKREFYMRFDRAKRDPESLFEDIEIAETKTDIFLKTYHKSLTDGLCHEDALDKSFQNFKKYLSSFREEKNSHHGDEISRDIDEKVADLSSDDIYNILNKKVS